jgi:hypothetical protein
MRFAIEDARDIDRPEFHHAPTFAAAIRFADELHESRAGYPESIIDLNTRRAVATIRPSWNASTLDIVIRERVYGRLSDIAAKCVRDSVGPRYRHIIPDCD